MLKAGVIAVQGDVAEHADAVRRAADRHGESCTVEIVRTAGVVPDCDLLLLPGGESTTISRLLADEGIDRYNGFLFAPTDGLSVLVGLSFLVAAASWWLVPELSFRLEWGLPLDLLLVVVLSCQTPMIVFLSLLTAIGRT